MFSFIIVTTMETKELHIIATVGNQDPDEGSNDERIQKTADDIVNLLRPSKLWVLSGPGDKKVYKTAEQLNYHLGDASLNPGNVGEDGHLAEHALEQDEAGEGWRSNLGMHSYLAFLRSEKIGQRHKTGLVLVTFEDIVKRIPEILGAEGYQDKTDAAYGGINYLGVAIDESGYLLDEKTRKE